VDDDKILWMVGEAAKDEMELNEDDIYLILASPRSVLAYNDAEIDYVHLLDHEYISKRRNFYLLGAS